MKNFIINSVTLFVLVIFVIGIAKFINYYTFDSHSVFVALSNFFCIGAYMFWKEAIYNENK